MNKNSEQSKAEWEKERKLLREFAFNVLHNRLSHLSYYFGFSADDMPRGVLEEQRCEEILRHIVYGQSEGENERGNHNA